MNYLPLSAFLLCSLSLAAAKNYTVVSPDGKLKTEISVGDHLSYSVDLNGKTVIAPSTLSMTLADGTVWGQNPKVSRYSKRAVDEVVESPFYRAESIPDSYNVATLDFKGGWGLEFRAYNDGIAYRFVAKQKKSITVADEEVTYVFPTDATAYVPYDRGSKNDPFFNSFENQYTKTTLSGINRDKLIFLPMTVDLGDDVKVTLTESDLEQFPGLYMTGTGTASLKGTHARYPKNSVQGGHNNLQMIVTEREDFISKTEGNRGFPWRVAIITDNDKDLAASNLSYLLASPSRVANTSWIKPGKVAWDWWNCWNLTGVDFKAGVNNDTYKKYIDFAADNGIEYVILDEGWAVNKKADLMQVVPEIDLKELIDYAGKKNVGIVLWAGYKAFERDMENICRHYSDMGVMGFKVDFMDRDDQEMVDFVHRAAQTCDKYKLFLDLHGMYKPAGLNRTYPHILNFEGVTGLEQMKWRTIDLDQVESDVMIPFIRQAAGPMDYTPGAMNNGTKHTYHADYYQPMSQGTRCRQLALFTVYDSPFTMLSDTPVNYDREPECRDFISSVPTVWDETLILDGKMGDYIVTARRSGDVWYVAGLTDWTPRELDVDLSFLGNNDRQAIIFKDGVNAARNANDYKKETVKVNGNTPLKVSLAPGGGFSMVIK